MRLNISIDDICPHPDCRNDVLDNCLRLIDKYSDIKFSLFIPMSYMRLGEEKYNLKDYPKFCKTLADLPINNFEFCWHGYLHGIKDKSSNDEFRYLGYGEAHGKIKDMFAVSQSVGLKERFSPVFRPPAFWISEGSLRALEDDSIAVVALSPLRHHVNSYRFSSSSGLIATYWTSLPPQYPLQTSEDVSIVYHANSSSKNCFSGKLVEELTVFLNQYEFDFSYMQDLHGEVVEDVHGDY